MIKSYKMLFFSLLIISIMMAISSYSWMSMWISLEINLMSFIPLLYNNLSTLNMETMMKYFIIQALTSSILMMSIIIMSMNSSFFVYIFNSSLLMKMGAAPFHFWFPEIMESLSWMNCFILMTMQKIAPMILIIYNNYMFFIIIIIFSLITSGLMGLNQISLRKILAYSSINHIGWMLSILMLEKYLWLIYFLFYSMITLNIIFILNKYNINFINHLLSFNNLNLLKLFFMMNMLSLGGMPPFIGFLPKWMIINSLMYKNNHWLAYMMVIITMMTLYYYLRLIFNAIILSNNNLNFKFNFYKISKFIMFYNFILMNSLIIITLMINIP